MGLTLAISPRDGATGSHVLLRRIFSRVFSHLLNLNLHFDFDAAIALVPRVIQDNLTDWVDDHVDALVAEFAPEDDAIVIAVGEGDADDANEDDASDSSGGMDEDNEDGAEGSAFG